MNLISLRGLLVLSGAFAIGCGGSSVSLDDLPSEFTTTICNAQVACGAYADVESCLASIDLSEIDQLAASVEAGRADYDGDKADECINGFANINNCEIINDPAANQAAQDACDAVFTGNVAVGGDCVDDEECVDNGECEIPDCQTECCIGTCAAGEPDPTPVAIGQDCSEAPCVDGAVCQAQEVGRTCVARAAEGQECTGFGSGTCAAGLVCDAFSGTSTCSRPAATGETCDPALGFGFLSCLRSDNWCDPADNTCKARPVTGEACGGEVDNCIDYAYCSNSVCVAKPSNGQACGGTEEIDCVGSYECVNDVCTPDIDSDPVCTI